MEGTWFSTPSQPVQFISGPFGWVGVGGGRERRERERETERDRQRETDREREEEEEEVSNFCVLRPVTHYG